nr:hypothetical protein CFP56_02758 [Quercus suber]
MKLNVMSGVPKNGSAADSTLAGWRSRQGIKPLILDHLLFCSSSSAAAAPQDPGEGYSTTEASLEDDLERRDQVFSSTTCSAISRCDGLRQLTIDPVGEQRICPASCQAIGLAELLAEARRSDGPRRRPVSKGHVHFGGLNDVHSLPDLIFIATSHITSA